MSEKLDYEYGVIVGETPQDLEKQVERYRASGFKPQGGLSVCVDLYGNKLFSQAMIHWNQPEPFVTP